MNTGSLERSLRASLGLSLVIALGCDITPYPTTPTTTPTSTATPGPTLPRSVQQLAALALFEAAAVHLSVATAPFTFGTDNGKAMWTNGPCAFGQGSMEGSLDGGLAPIPGTFLPTGSHTYVVSFRNCSVNYWGNEAFDLNGVTSAAYDVVEWSNIMARVSADSVHAKGLAFRSELHDVTADGSAVWTRTNNSTTYTPDAGSRLVNNSTTHVATFGGGSYSTISQGGRTEWRFDNLTVTVSGTKYSLNGTLVSIHTQPLTTDAGEIRIVNDGTLVARIYGAGVNDLRIEVLVPLVPL